MNVPFSIISILLLVGGLFSQRAVHAQAPLWIPILIVTSLVIVPPGQTSVVQFFGRYVGTVSHPGFWWVLPLTIRRGMSVRVRNFETNHLKVNDADGNPITADFAVETVKAVLGATGLPLVVLGPGLADLDNEVLVPVAEATKGEREDLVRIRFFEFDGVRSCMVAMPD